MNVCAKFQLLACLEVAEKFVCGWVGGQHVATVSNLCFDILNGIA